MIHYKQGDIFKSRDVALVNPVNTVGVMGAGLAAEFKERWPDNFLRYKRVCDKKQLKVGKLLVIRQQRDNEDVLIVNFPTKKHWRNPSRQEWVDQGLDKLAQFIASEESLTSISIPALGAGYGGLPWPDVKASIEARLSGFDNVSINVYEPLK